MKERAEMRQEMQCQFESLNARMNTQDEQFQNIHNSVQQLPEKMQMGAINVVSNINKMGIIAYFQIDEKYKTTDNDFDNSPLIIIIPNEIINESDLNLNDITIGRKLDIEILGHRIKYRNEKVQIVGKIL